MKKTAILLGATGLTGSHLLQLILADSTYAKVIVFTRRTTGIQHPKLVEYCIDLLQLHEHVATFKGDVVFCCIGTTKAKTADKVLYRQIDYGIPVAAAQLAKQNEIPQIQVISALGANANSKSFYNRTKGEMEQAVSKERIPHTYFFQPSLIVGDRKEKRAGENLAKVIMRLFDWATPTKYKSISAKRIAEAMLYIAENGYPKTIIPSEEIQKLTAKD